jgi:predicted DNA-binding transcriptional regulator AlpA
MPARRPLLDLTVTEDPVTGTWTLTLCGHRIEIERAHGFVKVDGVLHRVPLVQELREVEDLAGAPLDQLTQLIPSTQGAQPQAPRANIVRPASAHDERRAVQHPRATRVKHTPAPPPQPHKGEAHTETDAQRTVLPTLHAATYLGLSPKTLETLRTRGGGPPFLKLGRRVVYRKADLDTWLAARVRRSTSDPGE